MTHASKTRHRTAPDEKISSFLSPALNFPQITKAARTVSSIRRVKTQFFAIRRPLYLWSIDCHWTKHSTVYSYKTIYNPAQLCPAPLQFYRRRRHYFTYESTTSICDTSAQYKAKKKLNDNIVYHPLNKYFKQSHFLQNLISKPQQHSKLVLSLQR